MLEPLMKLNPTEALSGITGSISLVCWIFVLVPQLIENYTNGHANGISLSFLTIWLLGDICNLLGSLWAKLLPTVVCLAVYFCIADVILIGQCLYYQRCRPPKQNVASDSGDRETDPLISRAKSNPLDARLEQRHEHRSTCIRTSIKNVLSVVVICVFGTAAWVIAWQAQLWHPAEDERSGDSSGSAGRVGMILGYASAACYLGARMPQIIKNARQKSCEGLSLLFFILSILGNLTFGASILFHSLEKQYIQTNLPWLLGSLGTMAQDFLIFWQFHQYTGSDSAEVEHPIEHSEDGA